MKPLMRIVISLSIILLPIYAGAQTVSTDRLLNQEEEQRIRESFEESWSAAEQGDLNGNLKFFSEDVIVMLSDQPTMVGKESLRQNWSGMYAAFHLKSVRNYDEIKVDQKLAYAYLHGHLELTNKENDSISTIQWRAIYILEKINGNWQITRYISNNPPMD